MYAGQRIWMIDDDTTIRMSSIRKRDDKRRVDKINQLTREQFYELIQYVEDAMDCGYYHGHARLPIFKITSSWGNYRENSYGFTNTWYDLGKLTTEQIGYGKIDLCEDMYAFLNLINQGYPHLALFKYLVVSGNHTLPAGAVQFVVILNIIERLNKSIESFQSKLVGKLLILKNENRWVKKTSH